VVLNARDAAARGADIRTRTACVAARPVEGGWSLGLSSGADVRARVLVNAAGPWVSRFLSEVVQRDAPTRVRLVKGSHLVVRRLFAHEHCYIFQNRDGRICFAIPYERDFTLIGTTDEDFRGDPYTAAVSPEEEAYLLEAVGSYLRVPIDPGAIVWRYAGVRPLRDDGTSAAQEATRDYVFELEGSPPLLSVFGGKLTTYRRLAEAAMAKLGPFFPGLGRPWTATAALPGGDFPWDGAAALGDALLRRYRFLTVETAERYVHAYGTMTSDMLAEAGSAADLGAVIGADLTEREAAWLVRTEWAQTADDILWRRSKLGLRFDAGQRVALEAFLAAKR
jgi:glycerol-3-phosphate dehydrogenase